MLRHLATLVTVAAVLPLSCRPYRMPGAEALTQSAVATITQSPSVVALEIDGNDTGLSRQFEIGPGTHTIQAEAYRGGKRRRHVATPSGRKRAGKVRGVRGDYVGTCTLELTTERGGHYHLQSGQMANAWGIWITETEHPIPWPTAQEHHVPRCECQ
jgi:hypothetical protein